MAERDNSGIIERGPGFREGLRDLPAAINLNSVSAGAVAAIFGCSGPALIVIGAAAAGTLTSGQTVAWLLAIYGLGGLISLLLALRYKMPINGAYSIPGAAIMTAAFARELGMTVRYQEVQVEDTWNREGGLYLISSHVNLSLAPRAPRVDDRDSASMLTVDFVPSIGNSRDRVRYLNEGDIVALYMNNRAAEELVLGHQAEAYWWARAALLKRPARRPHPTPPR